MPTIIWGRGFLRASSSCKEPTTMRIRTDEMLTVCSSCSVSGPFKLASYYLSFTVVGQNIPVCVRPYATGPLWLEYAIAVDMLPKLFIKASYAEDESENEEAIHPIPFSSLHILFLTIVGWDMNFSRTSKVLHDIFSVAYSSQPWSTPLLLYYPRYFGSIRMF